MCLHLQTNLLFTKTLLRNLPHFISGPGEMQPRGLWGMCLAVAVLSHIPWVRFTCTCVGKQQDLQGITVFGHKALVAKVGCMSRRQGSDLWVKHLCLESPR